MNSCDGCKFLRVEQFKGGSEAARCFAPFRRPWGNGRIVGNPAPRLLTEKIERPKWCEKENK